MGDDSPQLLGLGRPLDVAARAGRVTRKLLAFGFGEFLSETGLDRWLPGRSEREEARAEEPMPVRVRRLLEELGPTFVKTGQILSTRPDLIPPHWTTELSRLQSEVPAAPWEGEDGVRALLEGQYGERLAELFEDLEPEAMAAGSMAQVHRARLASGERVVLKVLRPGIRKLVAADLQLMGWFAHHTQGFFEERGFDAEGIVGEFARQLERETDLHAEARSTERMRRDFEDHPAVSFPRVYAELSTRDVLVLEEVRGELLSKLDIETLDLEQRTRIVRHGADVVFRQCLDLGFFHADPHPGNIMVLEGQRLVVLDCGMTGLLDPDTIDLVASLVHGTAQRNLDRVERAALLLADAQGSPRGQRALRSDLWQLLDHFHEGSLESIRMGELLQGFFELLREHRLRCPTDIVYLIKALTTIEGVAARIAPDFDLVGYVRPHVERLMRKRAGPKALRRRLEEALLGYTDLAEDLPGHLDGFLRTLRAGKVAFHLDHRGLEELTGEIERASMNVSTSFVVAAMIVAAALLVLADSIDGSPSTLTTVATVTILFAALVGIGRILVSRLGR